MRLIDADALNDSMYHEAFETDSELQKWDSGCWIRYKMFENHLDMAPTADAVPVVRCGECKYYEPHIDYLTGKPYRFGECEKIGERDQEGGACFSRNTDDDDFCSYGERKKYV